MAPGVQSGTAVVHAKKLLRRAISSHLAALPAHQVHQECPSSPLSERHCSQNCTNKHQRADPCQAHAAQAVVAHLVSSPHYAAASSVSVYLSTAHSEVHTDAIIRHALEHGKRIYVPYCPTEDKTTMRMLRLRDEHHLDHLATNRWGIREVDPAEVRRASLGEVSPPSALADPHLLLPPRRPTRSRTVRSPTSSSCLPLARTY